MREGNHFQKTSLHGKGQIVFHSDQEKCFSILIPRVWTNLQMLHITKRNISIWLNTRMRNKSKLWKLSIRATTLVRQISPQAVFKLNIYCNLQCCLVEPRFYFWSNQRWHPNGKSPYFTQAENNCLFHIVHKHKHKQITIILKQFKIEQNHEILMHSSKSIKPQSHCQVSHTRFC